MFTFALCLPNCYFCDERLDFWALILALWYSLLIIFAILGKSSLTLAGTGDLLLLLRVHGSRLTSCSWKRAMCT